MSGPLDGHAQALLAAHTTQGVRASDLAKVLEAGRTQSFSAGDPLCTEGTPADTMFFLLEGSVKVMRRDVTGKRRELATMIAPALVGHMALMDDAPRSASCLAVGKVLVVTLQRGPYLELLETDSLAGAALRRLLLSCLTHQLTRGNAMLRNLTGPRKKKAPAAGGAGKGAKAQTKASSGMSDDVSVDDLLKVTGALEGWKISDAELEGIEFVPHEQGKSNRRRQ